MGAGMLPALVIPLIPWFNGVNPLYYFPIILAFSVLGCVAGAYSAPPTELEVLKKFYAKTRPWGFWKPIHDLVVANDPSFQKNTAFGRDMANVAIGIVWQCALIVAPIYLVLQQYWAMGTALMVIVVASLALKKNWYDRL